MSAREKKKPAYSVDQERRKFLGRAITSATMLGATGGITPAIRDAVAQSCSERRYLVSIPCSGGWQATLGLDGQPPNELEWRGIAADRFTRWCGDGELIAHPLLGSQHMLGPQMSIFNRDDFRELCIWRHRSTEGHIIGNLVQNTGLLSKYAAAYAPVIANKMGSLLLKPLHYAVVGASSPDDVFSPVGMLTGAAANPVMISNYASWDAMTSQSGTDRDPDLNRRLSEVVDGLGKEIVNGGAKLRSTQALFDYFLSCFRNGLAIKGSDWARGAEFLGIWDAYTDAITDIVVSHPYGSSYYNFIATREGWRAWIKENVAFSPAVTEFLIKKDLSSVIQFPLPCGDHHSAARHGIVTHFCTLAAYRTMLARFRTETLPCDLNTPLIQVTTFAMHTEFVRAPVLNGRYPPGTDHWPTATVLLAGAGVNGGKVIGELAWGPEGRLGRQFPGAGYYGLCPYDNSTGETAAGGRLPMSASLFPTMLGLMNTSVPSNQLTPETEVRAVRKA